MELPGLKLEAQLGHSGLTDAWQARQVHLNRPVTVKILREEPAADPREVRSFHDEARRISALKHHNILDVFDVGEHHGTHYMIMEYAPGPTVSAMLSEHSRLPPDFAFGLALQAADALAYAWNDHRLIHRNLSPKSFVLGADKTLKLAYTGLSLRVDPTHPDKRLEHDMIEGTPQYMAPEQIENPRSVDCRTDQYGLGATLYHMITGTAPFADLEPLDAIHAQISEQVPHPGDLVPGLAPHWADVVARLMMKPIESRFTSWETAAAALKRALTPDRLRIERRRKHITVSWSTIADPATAATQRDVANPSLARRTAPPKLIIRRRNRPS